MIWGVTPPKIPHKLVAQELRLQNVKQKGMAKQYSKQDTNSATLTNLWLAASAVLGKPAENIFSASL